MNHFICETCGTQFERSEAPPENCPICEDERQYVGWKGQSWTTHDALSRRHRVRLEDHFGLLALGLSPTFAIDQRAFLIPTANGNILWECLSVVTDEAVHETRDGRRLLVLHGDKFDVVIRNSKWLAKLGSSAYDLVLRFNTYFNRVRRALGYSYWSISAYLKGAVKNAVSYIDSFEEAVLREAEERGFDGVVCGHIHKAQIREEDGITYYNDGDWVESCTALGESPTGELALIDWVAEMREREELAAREAEAAAPAYAGLAG